MRKSHFKKSMLLLGVLAFTIACTPQGRLTYLTFQESDDYEELKESMELLQEEGMDGSTRQQFSALKNLRYISKQMEDPGKQELAVEGLVFLTAFSDDGDVREQSEDRLNAIMEPPRWWGWDVINWAVDLRDWDPAMKLAVIRGQRDVVTGEMGYIDYDDAPLVPADFDERDNALAALVDYFPAMPPLLQLHMLQEFEVILTTPENPADGAEGIYDSDFYEDQEELREELKSALLAFLKDQPASFTEALFQDIDVPLVLKRQIVELMDRVEPSDLETWNNEEDLSDEVKAMITATRDRRRFYVTQTETPEIFYDQLESQSNHFLAMHLGAIFKKLATTPDMAITPAPAEWLFKDYGKSEEGKERQMIVIQAFAQATKAGLVLSDDQLIPQILSALDTAESLWEVHQATQLTAALYPSLNQQGVDITQISTTLIEKSKQASTTLSHRMYLYALLEGFPYYPEIVENSLTPRLSKEDVVTRYRIQQTLSPTETLETPSNDTMESSDSESTEESLTGTPDEELTGTPEE